MLVDDLGLPLEQPLLQVERRQVADLVGIVQQRLHDAEEERAPESDETCRRRDQTIRLREPYLPTN